ncbi:hypothetical protein ACA910_005743 [Epithemia clementina (nom. ined.)]
MSSLTVLTPIDPSDIKRTENHEIVLGKQDKYNDALDKFNHPRIRRLLILSELEKRTKQNDRDNAKTTTTFVVPSEMMDLPQWMKTYSSIHSSGVLDFLATAWTRWSDYQEGLDEDQKRPLMSGNSPLMRDINEQRPSKHPIGQMGYYSTDLDTPVFSNMLDELLMDGRLVQTAAEMASVDTTVYVLVTHPGHHAGEDTFGGFCYVNHIAALAKLFMEDGKQYKKVAILDVDYHVGNGTASLFYSDPSVLVVSIHCDPDYDYPFHSGFSDQTGSGEGLGTTLHLPLPPGTDWNKYSGALKQGLEAIQSFGAEVLLVSLGLDTHDNDPVCIRRAGFGLKGDDFVAMGAMIAEMAPQNAPVVFLQEGGYNLEKVAQAASDVVTSFCHQRKLDGSS